MPIHTEKFARKMTKSHSKNGSECEIADVQYAAHSCFGQIYVMHMLWISWQGKDSTNSLLLFVVIPLFLLREETLRVSIQVWREARQCLKSRRDEE